MVQRPKYLTPRGVLSFPCAIAAPDTKFSDDTNPNDKGSFKARLVLEKGSPEQVKFQEKLDAIWNEHFEEICRTKNKNPKTLKVDPDNIPWTDETDEDGNETGNIIYRMKLNARVTKKDGTFFDQRPKVFDCSNVLLKQVPNIGPGSEVKIAGQVNCWFSSKIGMTLWLEGVQLHKLVEGGSGNNAESFGFGEEEGGFTNEGEFADAVSGGDEGGDF